MEEQQVPHAMQDIHVAAVAHVGAVLHSRGGWMLNKWKSENEFQVA